MTTQQSPRRGAAPPTIALLCGIVALSQACSSESNGPSSGSPGSGGTGGLTWSTGGLAGSGGTAGGANTGGITNFPAGSDGSAAGGAPTGCTASGAAETALQPVRLAFVFDVSASMGELDKPYHDPKLKWQPVVTATKAFFADPESAGISASLRFFPIDADEDERCSEDSYSDPNVPFTPLPSDEFARAIDAETPKTQDDWISGTPTLAALGATLGFARAAAKTDPDFRYAVVLVSDGYPQGCDDNDIESVAAVAKDAAGTMPTYVIGVSNPPGGPDTVSNLNEIAVAGGTDHAFVIETGDPEKTKNDFLNVVRAIRSGAVSCSFAIPEPPQGQSFDRTKANVSYASGATSADFTYDPECGSEGAWRFDDEDAPTAMVLCDDTCAMVRRDAKAALRVEFGCTRREVIR
jgi:hypothetical protein